ncbi:hypothetical protein BDK51DRAFT_52578 [Blyttiomyces helicus]|uniref:Uncharacterized protein n=1 Tax=Blyttiomyces helicus TaxID=388810 RepID=A0A4P9WFZ1_9FUNG|nr:hypothetical protein BDK51DRAFT_52578 [Blyttiomyces helicus]|eukprot:RKO89940.1 hypothetical protein BDK51DRAFT_52578 [Blyttiomyces helicus]
MTSSPPPPQPPSTTPASNKDAQPAATTLQEDLARALGVGKENLRSWRKRPSSDASAEEETAGAVVDNTDEARKWDEDVVAARVRALVQEPLLPRRRDGTPDLVAILDSLASAGAASAHGVRLVSLAGTPLSVVPALRVEVGPGAGPNGGVGGGTWDLHAAMDDALRTLATGESNVFLQDLPDFLRLEVSPKGNPHTPDPSNADDDLSSTRCSFSVPLQLSLRLFSDPAKSRAGASGEELRNEFKATRVERDQVGVELHSLERYGKSEASIDHILNGMRNLLVNEKDIFGLGARSRPLEEMLEAERKSVAKKIAGESPP